jgi:hypothetical protein
MSFYHVNAQSFSSDISTKNYKTKYGTLISYNSSKQKIYFVTDRPVLSNESQLFVPAAFTSDVDYKIVDSAVCFGNPIFYKTDANLNAYCIIEYGKPIIILSNELTDELKKNIISSKSSLFKQCILIKKKKLIRFPFFNEDLKYWRALAIFKDHFEIIENTELIRIKNFQLALQEIGVVDAIYLDMGSWSEGAYLNSKNQKVRIGHEFGNTIHQTNWIVF